MSFFQSASTISVVFMIESSLSPFVLHTLIVLFHCTKSLKRVYVVCVSFCLYVCVLLSGVACPYLVTRTVSLFVFHVQARL